MSKPTVIQIEARGNEGDSSSRARVLLAGQPWVRRTAGCDIAARDAAAKYFGVCAGMVILTKPFSGIYSARVLSYAPPHLKLWRSRRSASAIVPDTILIEEADDIACPIGMIHEGTEPHHKARGAAIAALVVAAPRYHGAVASLIATSQAQNTEKFLAAYSDLQGLFAEVEAEFSKIQQPSTGGAL